MIRFRFINMYYEFVPDEQKFNEKLLLTFDHNIERKSFKSRFFCFGRTNPEDLLNDKFEDVNVSETDLKPFIYSKEELTYKKSSMKVYMVETDDPKAIPQISKFLSNNGYRISGEYIRHDFTVFPRLGKYLNYQVPYNILENDIPEEFYKQISELNILYLDTEVETKTTLTLPSLKNRFLSIQYSIKKLKDLNTIRPDDVVIIEKDFCDELYGILQKNNIHYIVGYNIFGFDFNHIRAKCSDIKILSKRSLLYDDVLIPGIDLYKHTLNFSSIFGLGYQERRRINDVIVKYVQEFPKEYLDVENEIDPSILQTYPKEKQRKYLQADVMSVMWIMKKYKNTLFTVSLLSGITPTTMSYYDLNLGQIDKIMLFYTFLRNNIIYETHYSEFDYSMYLESTD